MVSLREAVSCFLQVSLSLITTSVKKGAQYSLGQGNNFVPAILELVWIRKRIFAYYRRPSLSARPANLGRSLKLKVGERVYAVGSPKGLELSLSEGIVSQLRGGPPPIIQTTAAVSPGSSGGGLFNAEGELVGITTFQMEEGQNLNFALPVEWIAQAALQAPVFQPQKEYFINKFQIGSQWQFEWKSEYYYRGILEIQSKIALNQYLSRITVNFLNEKNIQRTVSFDGLLIIQGNDVIIHCSNASESWWVTDDFILKRQNNVMEGYSVDKVGRKGYARFILSY